MSNNRGDKIRITSKLPHWYLNGTSLPPHWLFGIRGCNEDPIRPHGAIIQNKNGKTIRIIIGYFLNWNYFNPNRFHHDETCFYLAKTNTNKKD